MHEVLMMRMSAIGGLSWSFHGEIGGGKGIYIPCIYAHHLSHSIYPSAAVMMMGCRVLLECHLISIYYISGAYAHRIVVGFL